MGLVFKLCLNRKKYDFGVKLRARALLTIPDSTSQKFLLLGQTSRKDQVGDGRSVIVYLDFAPTRQRQCIDDDFDKWYARTAKGKECLMGHRVRHFVFSVYVLRAKSPFKQQWYRRRKGDANCYVGKKYDDPIEHEDNCPCEEEDYEWLVLCFVSIPF
jgi:hypothetical protein